jgi:elongation factor G
MMQERLKANPVPIVIPVGAEDHFTGVVDLIKMRTILWDDATQGMVFSYAPVPDDLLETAQVWREKMVSAAAEASDALMDKYLERAILMKLKSSTVCVFAPSPGRSSRCCAAVPLKTKGTAHAGCGCRADAIATGYSSHRWCG